MKGDTLRKFGGEITFDFQGVFELDGGTDLDRLHAVVSMENPGRGAGRTFADCHTVAGVIETTEEPGAVCLVPKYNRVTDIMKTMVFQVFPEHGIHFHRSIHNNFFVFTLPGGQTKNIKFITLERAEEELWSNDWPIVEFTEYKRKGADNWKNRVPLM